MPGDCLLMSLGVEDLEFTGVFGVIYNVALGVTNVVALWFSGKGAHWVTGKVVF